jgi:hypothetical protein
MNEYLQSSILIKVYDPDPIKEMHRHTTARQVISRCDICGCEISVYFGTMSTGKYLRILEDTVVLQIHTVSHPRTRIFKL